MATIMCIYVVAVALLVSTATAATAGSPKQCSGGTQHTAILLINICCLSTELQHSSDIWQPAVASGTAVEGPTRFDPIVSNSTLYGRPNMSDSVWHDDTWAHKRWGPISRLTLYKAWYYDGEWHDPGEFKGIQAW
jgi:hypothetical protein